jgi:hypothetical protein
VSVEALIEPDGTWVVACFRSDCPEHGEGCYTEPWVDEFNSKSQAAACAREHRAMIRHHWLPEACSACGHRIPREDA